MRLTRAITKNRANTPCLPCGNFRALGDAPHPRPRSISGAADTSCTAPAATPKAPHRVRSLTRPPGPHEPHSRPHLRRERSSRHNSRCRPRRAQLPHKTRASMNSHCIRPGVEDVPGHQSSSCRELSVAPSLSSGLALPSKTVIGGTPSRWPTATRPIWSRLTVATR